MPTREVWKIRNALARGRISCFEEDGSVRRVRCKGEGWLGLGQGRAKERKDEERRGMMLVRLAGDGMVKRCVVCSQVGFAGVADLDLRRDMDMDMDGDRDRKNVNRGGGGAGGLRGVAGARRRSFLTLR